MDLLLSLKFSTSFVKMCNSGLKRQHHARAKQHSCFFRILQCSSQQLCVLCFLLYSFTAGSLVNATDQAHPTEAINGSRTNMVKCVNGDCYLKIISSEKALENMVKVSEHLFDSYAIANGSQKVIDDNGLEKFISDVGLMEDDHSGHDHGHDHDGHDHEGHDHDHDHEGHDHDHDHEGHDHGHDHEGHDHDHDHADLDAKIDEMLDDYFGSDYYYDDDDEVANNTRTRRSAGEEEFPCFSSMKELTRAYFHSSDSSQEVQLSFEDFIALMPRILLNLKRPECRFKQESEHDHDEDDQNNELDGYIWPISFATVLAISLLSLLGVLMIPLLQRSKTFNFLISFLVALAVGCLIGDALLHLLPHASGAHDHSSHGGHDHSSHEGHGHSEDDHFDSMWKGLVACMGIYVFFLLEAVMKLIHRKKSSKKSRAHHDPWDGTPPVSSPSQCEKKVTTIDCESRMAASPSDSPLLKKHHHHHGNGSTSDKDGVQEIVVDEEPLDVGLHHHHSHEVPQTIASLAWMVIIGDGLHNITDGLAIGAAFTSGIGMGLSTALAVFFHEIPQELGDFAVLLNAGMTVRQALLWNFLSACTCFVGLVIGLLLGEYTSGIIPWILAFTAGGFLYIALTDMLPVMVKQLQGKGYLKRFLLQNIGILTGFGIMVLIGLKEEETHGFF